MSSITPLLLEFDCGNSAAKWRLIAAAGVIKSGSIFYEHGFAELLESLNVPVEQIIGCRVVSVASPETERALKNAWQDYSVFPIKFASVQRECFGVRSGYDDLSQMGVDRWSAVVAAQQRVDGPCVIVDAGTAITVDIVDSRSCHCGGYIFPGFDLMLDSLNEKTAIPGERIPDAADIVATHPGKTTSAAIANALGLAVSAFVSEVSSGAAVNATLVLTGGQAGLLAPLLKQDAIILPDLVLDGLSLLVPMELKING